MVLLIPVEYWRAERLTNSFQARAGWTVEAYYRGRRVRVYGFYPGHVRNFRRFIDNLEGMGYVAKPLGRMTWHRADGHRTTQITYFIQQS